MKSLYAIALSACLSLGACGTLGSGGSTPPSPADIGAIIAKIQEVSAQVCAFVPTATTVADIIAGGNPAIVSVSAVANAICAAVTKQSVVRGVVTVPKVNGVPVNGSFVRR